MQRRAEQLTDALDAIPVRLLGPAIALAAGGGLLAELCLIRWHASAFQLFAYYKNVSLLAAFLGLGLGYARGGRRPVWLGLVLPGLCAQVGILQALRFSSLGQLLQDPVAEQLNLGLNKVESLSRVGLSYGALALVFGSTVLVCLPLGHLAARLMRRLPTLQAYSFNLGGSLVGIAAFTALSYLWLPPPIWILAIAAALLPFLLLGRDPVTLATSLLPAVAVAVALMIPLVPGRQEIYSPYQVLAITSPEGALPTLDVNNVYFQRINDLSPAARAGNPELEGTAQYYELPYALKPRPKRVLVVGAGTGNDVAAALRLGAEHVDAVEIDPAILAEGRKLHPERPYDDPRVEAIVADARGFLKRTDRRYDLIIYGLLDSHTQLSAMSSVRLDSFVYTVEGFRDARARLAEGGVLTTTFCLLSPGQGRKFYRMLEEAFDGRAPRVFEVSYDYGYLFAIGPGLPPTGPVFAVTVPEVTSRMQDPTIAADVSTDDWPFLYMPVRRYPVTYLVMLLSLLAVSLVLVRLLLPRGGEGGFHAPAFFLGAGFMLVETKGITELALTFGSTFQVTSAVIAGILVMGFLANLLVQRRGALPPPLAYGLLAASLAVGLLVPLSSLSGLPPLVERVVAVVLVTAPLFFSGLAFSGELGRIGSSAAGLSSNLLGAMLGGMLEYNSMYFGFRSLSYFALVLYGLAFVFALRGSRVATVVAPGPAV